MGTVQGFRVKGFRGSGVLGSEVQRFRGSEVLGSEVLGSAPPPAKKTAGQIEKETDEALHKQLINHKYQIPNTK